MSYIVSNTAGAVITTIIDGTKDDTSTSLTLLGRNFSNYGQYIAENFVHLLENFSYDVAPSNPIVGQLWWKRDINLLKVYTGTGWKTISSATAQDDAPSTTTAGDIWWDTNDEQLYVYNGTSPYSAAGWILVGPNYSALKGKSGALWEVIEDNLQFNHDVLSLYLDGARTSIISTDAEFTPNVAIAGFTTIKQGITANTQVGSGTFWGTANNTSYLGGQPASKFFRNDQTNVTSGNITILDNDGIRLGASQQLRVTLSSNDASITNTATNGDLNLYVNVGGVSTRALYIEGTTGVIQVAANPSTNLGIATKQYVDSQFTDTVLSGDPTTTTQAPGDNTTKVATTEFVHEANVGLKAYVDANLASTQVDISYKANIASPTFTGNPKAPTPTAGDNDTSIATTAFVYAANVAMQGYVDAADVLKAPIASPTFTGMPLAPTMPAGTANTSIATTEFVVNNSGFLKNKIYQGNSYFEILDAGTGSANLAVDGVSVMTASASGVFLKQGATAYTWGQTVSNTAIATTSYVRTAVQRWDGAAKFVSNAAPDANLGSNGDFWFQYES